MLRTNRDGFALTHPVSIRDCFFAHGMDVGSYEEMDSNEENSKTALATLARFADCAVARTRPCYLQREYIDIIVLDENTALAKYFDTPEIRDPLMLSRLNTINLVLSDPY